MRADGATRGEGGSASAAEPSAATRGQRPRDPERTKRDILVAAREEFVEHGLDGARVDRIALRAGANKRLLYHYVGNKEALYRRVLLDAYRDIREGERALHLTELGPVEAMERLVGFTFDHFRDNPWFIRLLATENIQRAAFVSQMPEIRALHSPLIEQIGQTLRAGETAGVFRAGVDPVQLYVTIAGLSYFYFSNAHTLSVIFDRPLLAPDNLAERRRHAIDVAIGFLGCAERLALK